MRYPAATPFADLLQRAFSEGIIKKSHFARVVGVDRALVDDWLAGAAPGWDKTLDYIPRIAEAIKQPAEVVADAIAQTRLAEEDARHDRELARIESAVRQWQAHFGGGRSSPTSLPPRR